MDYDFSGWATRNNIQCSDGRTIMKDAFKDNDGQKVPLVWNHQHNDPNNVLGHAILENRAEGVYAYCKFNNTESGQTAKELVASGNVDKLSIYANKLKSQNSNVTHGCIREVSLVLAGANPGAYIDSVVMHSDDPNAEAEEEGTIYTDEPINVTMEHSDEDAEEVETVEETEEPTVEETEEVEAAEEVVETSEEVSVETEKTENSENNEEAVEHSEEKSDKEESTEVDKKESDKTIAEVVATMNEEQQNAMYAIVGQALEEGKKEEKGDETMKHNVFENEKTNEEVLAHSEIIADAIADAKRYGSMKQSFIEHAAINNIEGLDKILPDYHPLNKEPIVIEEDNSWVAKVINGMKHSPFSRVKATFGRMTEEQARAKGYIKGDLKTNIAMTMLNRTTTPTTIYIKNEIDRDDVIDITDFDVIAWQKREMRKLLDKEIALAVLLGDGRDPSDRNKINELNVRPIVSDEALYTIKYEVKEGVDYKIAGNSYSENDSVSKGIIRAAIKSRKGYKGSGKPTFFTTEDTLNDLLLIEDQNGRLIYESEEKLATALRVKEIVTVPEMEREAYADIYGIIVNMADYTGGADKGGAVNMFDDFDIDYNQMKYLMETRMSGALTVPYSAIVLKKAQAAG